MAFSLDDLVKDGRLERLFSKNSRDCALQLWVLQVESDDKIENRLLYGRLLPYNHSSNTWSAPEDDHFERVGGHRAQIIRLSLYIESTQTAGVAQSSERRPHRGAHQRGLETEAVPEASRTGRNDNAQFTPGLSPGRLPAESRCSRSKCTFESTRKRRRIQCVSDSNR